MKKAPLFLFVVCSLLFQGCNGIPAEATKTPEKIKIQLLPYMSYAPLYIAQEEGYFAEQGLEVEFLKLEGSTAFVSLATGEIDVAATIISSNMLSAIYQGENVKVVADKVYIRTDGCTAMGLLARRQLLESGELKDVGDMIGRKVKYDQASITAFFLDRLLNTAGHSLADIERFEVESQSLVMDAFKTGALDLSTESEPWITRNVNSGDALLWKDYNEIIPDYQFAVIYFGPNLLDKNPEVGRRFMLANLKAVRQYNQGKTERNMELMQAFTGLESDLLEQICWPPFRNDLSVNTQSILDFQDWAIANNLLDGSVSVEGFWDPSFMEYALSVVD